MDYGFPGLEIHQIHHPRIRDGFGLQIQSLVDFGLIWIHHEIHEIHYTV